MEVKNLITGMFFSSIINDGGALVGALVGDFRKSEVDYFTM